MASVLALLSKSFFESKVQVDGRAPEIGEVAPLDRYFSTNKRLEGLAEGGSLYLVTVRPPDEKLLLIAVLPEPVFEKKWWRAPAPNQVAVADISHLVSRLKFDNGKGISPKPGRLGMSLQTPRILCDEDIELFAPLVGATTARSSDAREDSAVVSKPSTGPGSAEPVDLTEQIAMLLAALDDSPDDTSLRERAARTCAVGGQPVKSAELLTSFIHLNAHEPGALPCLCKGCMDPELDSVATDGTSFVREFAIAGGRVLYYWLPEELAADRNRVGSDVAAQMRKRFGS